MKQHRALPWLAVIATLAVVMTLVVPIGMAGAAPAEAQPTQAEVTALVQVSVPTADDLVRFEQTGLPAYTRLEGREGNYLLAGATPAGLLALADAGLSARILDADMAGASYYLAYAMPGRKPPEWSAFGRVLLADQEQTLLRTTAQEAERLTLAGAELQMVTLTAKPLRPTVAQGVIPAVVEPDPLIQAMIDQVSTEEIYAYLRGFSGVEPVWVDGEWYTITTRDTDSGTPILKAAHYLGERYAAQGLDVEYHVWNASHGPNVIGERAGLVNPDDIYIIGGHLDDVPGTPGADDNASGPIAGLIAAEIVSQFEWGCTLRFVGWTGEEWGLLGSDAYAHRSWQMGENILGYLNLDMIAWNTIGSSPEIYLAYNSSMPSTLALAQLFADVVDAYNIDLIPELGTSLSGGSDHSSFWNYGYTAILGIEGYDDFNPYYHGPGDTVAHTDPTYFTNYVKASVATFAHMTGCLIPSGLGALDGHVTDAGSSTPIEGATVTAQSATGNLYAMTTDAAGYYTRTLLSGTYTVTAEAYGYVPQTVTGVEIVTGTVTTVDMAMAALPEHTVSGHVRDAGTNMPLAATVEFLDAPVPAVSTDPATGYYSITVAEGTWTMRATAAQHAAQTEMVEVTGDVQQNFFLWPMCDLIADDVESGNIGWTAQSPWAITTESAHSPTHSWTDSPGGAYGNNRNVSLTSSVWNLSDYGGLGLGFWHIYDTESGYDYCHVEYSTNGGSTWTEAASWNGENQTTWMYEEIPLPQLDGQPNVRIRFRFTSDVSVTEDGWHIDDIVLTGAGPECVPELAPVAEFTANSPVILGAPMVFTNQTTGTQPIGYQWDFGDGIGASTETDPTYIYLASGSYTVTLTATNGVGSDTVLHAVEVLPSSCEEVSGLGFTWAPEQPLPEQEVVFTGVASGTEPIEFEWAFGDGTSGSGAVVTHTYAVSDTYTVVMTASNACSAEGVTQDIVVFQPREKHYIYLPIVVREP